MVMLVGVLGLEKGLVVVGLETVLVVLVLAGTVVREVSLQAYCR